MDTIIKKATKIFSFFSTKDDAKLATMGDVNQVVDKFNNIFPYRMHDIQVTQSGTGTPTFSKLANGGSECTSNCGSICSACDCSKPCGNEKNGKFFVTTAYVSVGTYDFTINVDPTDYPNPIKNVGFFFGGLPSGETHVGITKLSSTVYRLTTTDKTYTVQNGLLTETVLAMKVYF